MKKLRRYPQAERDIAEAAASYAEESISVSNRFLAEVESTLARIRQMPGSGSPRFSHELGVSDLRMVLLHGFPYLLFYFDRESIDIVRVVHAHREVFGILLGLE